MAVFRSVSFCRENTPVNGASTTMSSVCISQSVMYVMNDKAGICGNTEYPVGAGYGVTSEPTLSSAPRC